MAQGLVLAATLWRPTRRYENELIQGESELLIRRYTRDTAVLILAVAR